MDAIDAPGLSGLVTMWVELAAGMVAFLAVFAVAAHAVDRLEGWWRDRRVRRDVAQQEERQRVGRRWRRVA